VPVSPTMARIALGERVRQIRDEAERTTQEAAEAAGVGSGSYNRFEKGRGDLSPRKLTAVLKMFGCDEDLIKDVLLQAKEATKEPWWAPFAPMRNFSQFVALETAADQVQEYSPMLVPGLMQCERYMRGIGLTQTEVELRQRRQRRLKTDQPESDGAAPPLRYWAIVEEGVLDRVITSPEVMREQYEYMADIAERPNVTFQVMPTSRGYHDGLYGSFSIFTFDLDSDERRERGYAETVIGSDSSPGNIYLEKTWQVRTLIDRYDQLRAGALPPAESLGALRERARRIE
jgi:transcriptional regulator with XRE-family HTH domain